MSSVRKERSVDRAGGAGEEGKDPKVAKLERQLNLVSYLLSARAPVPFSDMRAQVVGYDDEASPDAIEKRFDRDKADLRAIGVVIEYKADDPTGQAGYVIDKQGYFLPELVARPRGRDAPRGAPAHARASSTTRWAAT